MMVYINANIQYHWPMPKTDHTLSTCIGWQIGDTDAFSNFISLIRVIRYRIISSIKSNQIIDDEMYIIWFNINMIWWYDMDMSRDTKLMANPEHPK